MAFFSPSLMCADYGNLSKEISLLEKAGAERFHMDVMDGSFVPNFAMGAGDIRYVCSHTDRYKEVHLMIVNPGKYIDLFADMGVDLVYFHPEADYHPTTVIERIKDVGLEPGIVLNPGTSIELVNELLYIVKHVLIMGVNPGHAGQVYLPYVDRKIQQMLDLKRQMELEISVDGACSEKMIGKWAPQGVDGFVLGTAALFGKQEDYKTVFQSLRKLSGGTAI